MRKIKFLSIGAMVVALAACSSDDGIHNPNGAVENGETPFSSSNAALSSSLDEVSSSSIAKSSSSVTVYPEDSTGFFWAGKDGYAKVKTGKDDGSETSGYWFDYSDSRKGGSIVYPAIDDDNIYYVESVVKKYGGVKGSVVQEKSAKGSYAGLGFFLTGESGKGADVTEWEGLCVTFQTELAFKIILEIDDENKSHLVYKNYWTGSTYYATHIPWEAFSNESGQYLNFDEKLKNVSAIRFEFIREGSFILTEVGSFRTCGSEIPEDYHIRQAKIPRDAIPAETFWWDFTDTQGRVNTGYDDETSGYWYDFAASDNYDNTLSRLYLPYECYDGSYDPSHDCYDPYEYGSYFGSAAELYEGIKGCAVIDSTDENPYVGIGFNVVSEYQEGVDVTKWGGICLTYSSTAPIRVSISVEDEVNALGDFYWYGIAMPSDSVVTVDIPWSKFRFSAGWDGNSEIDGALKKVAAVKLKLVESGDFFIRKIGSLGLCDSH